MILLNKKIFIPAFCMLLFFPAAANSMHRSLFEIASDYQKKGRYLEALSFYNDIEMNSDFWKGQKTSAYYQNLGDLYFEYLGEDEKALEIYLERIEKFPNSPEIYLAYHHAAQAFYRLGEKDKADAFYKYLKINFMDYYNENRIEEEQNAIKADKMLMNSLVLSKYSPLPSRIRVLVARSEKPVSFFSKGAFDLVDDNGTLLRHAEPGTELIFSAAGGMLLLANEIAGKNISFVSDEGQEVKVNGRTYRGDLRIRADAGQVLVINHLDLEEYLYGVIPREVSPSWPEQSLLAQAVASRTYALYHMLQRARYSYDLFSTTSSQVYGGKGSEHPSARKAVDLTKGEILTINGKTVLALYHANSGGMTENMDSVWCGGLSYLKGVEDVFSKNRPGEEWNKKIKKTEIEKGLKNFGMDILSVTDITPVERAVSGRIKKLKIVQDEGCFYLSGNSFRLMVGPAKVKSSNFTIKQKKNYFVFYGKGYGHGVGMSQWGAYSMAKKGHGYKEILGYYYPGTKIIKY